MDGQPSDFTGKTKTEKIIMRIMFFLGKMMDKASRLFMVMMVMLVMAGIAKADGSAALTRIGNLCVKLGYEGPDCTFNFEKGKHEAEVLISVDENPDEARSWWDWSYSSSEVPTGSIQIKFLNSGAVAGNLYVPINSWSGYGYLKQLLVYQDAHPCLTVECVERRAEDEDYDGVSETDVADLEKIKSKLVFQAVDENLTEQVRKILNTTGFPVVTKVKFIELVGSNISNGGATTARAIVTIRAIKPNVTETEELFEGQAAGIAVDPRLE